MATGRKTVVVGQVIDPVAWGNPLWDQSVQTFASAADRTAQFAAPKQGAVTWLEDVKQLQVYNGTAWEQVGASNATDVPWTQVSTFTSPWGHYLTAPWSGVWFNRRNGVVTITGGIYRGVSAPVANEQMFTIPAGLAPGKIVQGVGSSGAWPTVRPDGTVWTGAAGSSPFSLVVTYGQTA